jgi:hypothetical protein
VATLLDHQTWRNTCQNLVPAEGRGYFYVCGCFN